MQYPGFTKDRTLREQISALERLAQEYQLVTKKDVQDDLMLGTLIRALPANIRNQVQLQITETPTYPDVKDRVLAFEMVSTTWSHQKVQQELGLPGANPQMQGPGYQGPAPMEIDAIQYKGGKKWQQGGGWPPCKGGKKSGKGKDKGKTGKGKGQGDSSKCLYCGKPGHWKRDCRQFQRDRENGVIAPEFRWSGDSSGSSKPGVRGRAGEPITGAAGENGRGCDRRCLLQRVLHHSTRVISSLPWSSL